MKLSKKWCLAWYTKELERDESHKIRLRATDQASVSRGTSKQLCSEVRISRNTGRSDEIIGTPEAIYSKAS